MKISVQDGHLAALEYTQAGGVKFPVDWSLFLLRVRNGDGETVLGENDMALDSENRSGGEWAIVRSWTTPDGDSLRVRVTTRPGETEAVLAIQVDNETGLEVTSLDFPRLPVPAVTPSHAMYIGSPWGSRNFDPVKLLRENHNGEAYRRYPADLAMQFGMISDGRDTYYLSAYQLGDETFDLRCEALGEDGIVLSNRWYPCLRTGRWCSPDTGIARLAGDWHAGADLYRAHMGNHFRPPEPNPWLHENFNGWVQVGLKDVGKPPKHRFSELPAIYDRAAETGLNVLHVYGWAGTGHDSLYPDYDANPDLGTEQEFRDAMAAIKAKGGRVMIYTNGRLIDPESNFHNNVSSDSAIISEDGSRPTEHYGNNIFFEIACPSAPAYRDYFKEQVRKIMTRIRPHAIQIDQIGCNPSFLCYSESHGHSKPSGNWLPGIDRFLSELRDLYLSLDPEFFVWVEGMHERFGRHYDIAQGHIVGEPWNIGEPYPELFTYTYPDYLAVEASGTFDEMLHGYVQGLAFDFHLKSLGDERFKRVVTELVAVRKAETNYFRDGRYTDTVGLSADGEGIEVRGIHGRDGGTMVHFWAPGSEDEAEHEVRVSGEALAGSPRGVYPADVSVRQDSGSCVVLWTGPIASVAWE